MPDPRLEPLLARLDYEDILVRWPWLGWGIEGVEVTQATGAWRSATA